MFREQQSLEKKAVDGLGVFFIEQTDEHDNTSQHVDIWSLKNKVMSK